MIQENKILENESQPTPSQPIEPTTISATSKLTFNHSIFMLSFILQDFSCDGKKLKFYCVCDRIIIYFEIYFDHQNIDHVSKCKLKWIETWILVHFNVIDRLWSEIIPQSQTHKNINFLHMPSHDKSSFKYFLNSNNKY